MNKCTFSKVGPSLWVVKFTSDLLEKFISLHINKVGKSYVGQVSLLNKKVLTLNNPKLFLLKQEIQSFDFSSLIDTGVISELNRLHTVESDLHALIKSYKTN